MIKSFWRGLKGIIDGSGLSVVSSVSTAENILSCFATMDDTEESDQWQDLPAEIAALIEDQPGLWFNPGPIASREDPERAYCYLHDFVLELNDTPKTLESPASLCLCFSHTAE